MPRFMFLSVAPARCSGAAGTKIVRRGRNPPGSGYYDGRFTGCAVRRGCAYGERGTTLWGGWNNAERDRLTWTRGSDGRVTIVCASG